jgi:hypothetical protein
MVTNKRTGNFAQRIAINATLALIVMLALLVPAYSQQETDPTWYNPWAAPNQAVVQRPQSRLTNRKQHGGLRSATTSRRRSKNPAIIQTARNHERTREISQNR